MFKLGKVLEDAEPDKRFVVDCDCCGWAAVVWPLLKLNPVVEPAMLRPPVAGVEAVLKHF